MTDKFAQYTPSVKWTSNGPVRITRPAPPPLFLATAGYLVE